MRNVIVALVAMLLGGLPLPLESGGFSRAQATWQEGYCPPGLKFVAGACVSACPSGYADRGRVCVWVNQNH